jgi:hypothetical protein
MTGQGGTETDNLFGFIQLGFDLFQARLPLFYIVSALVDRFGNSVFRQSCRSRSQRKALDEHQKRTRRLESGRL